MVCAPLRKDSKYIYDKDIILNKVIYMEKEIIKLFVKSNKQERILYEFKNVKKRENGIWRFSDPGVFKETCLNSIGYMSSMKLEKYLLQLNKNEKVYFIGESYIGEMLLKDAAEKADMGEICLIYCGNGVGYYQGEQEIGSPPRYVLISK